MCHNNKYTSLAARVATQLLQVYGVRASEREYKNTNETVGPADHAAYVHAPGW